MAPSDTVFVFVPGAFHVAAHYQPIIDELDKRAYKAEAVNFPTIGEADKIEDKSLEDEIKAIQDIVDKYVKQEKNVVLCPHSFGGFSGSRAVKGREVSPRNKFGIKHVYFLTAFMVPEEVSVEQLMNFAAEPDPKTGEKNGLPDWIEEADLEKGSKVRKIRDHAPALFFSDLPPAEQEKWAKKLKCHNRDSAVRVCKGACWDVDVPKTYLMTTNDQATPTFVQQLAYDSITQGRPEKEWSMDVLHSGHAPFISQPDKLADLLISKA